MSQPNDQDGFSQPALTSVTQSKKRSKIGRTAGAIVVAAGVTAGGFALVGAANAEPVAGSASASTATASSDPVPLGNHGGGGPRGGGPGGGLGGGFGQALHGEFVVAVPAAADGSTAATTKTVRVQTGSVTAIGDGALTVLSSDGFSATYTLPAEVDVTEIAVGDTVTVQAEVSGDVVTANRVHEKGTEPGGGRHGGPPPAGASTAPRTPAPPTTSPSDPATSPSDPATSPSDPATSPSDPATSPSDPATSPSAAPTS